MHGPGALHAGLLTRTLLQHYCQQQPVPIRWLKKPEQGGSIVLGLASKFKYESVFLSLNTWNTLINISFC